MFTKNIYRNFFLIVCLLVLLINCQSKKTAQETKQKYISKGKIDYALSSDDEAMLDSIQYKTFLFFLNENYPEVGGVKDKSSSDAPISIAATGFGLPSLAVGVERGWMSRDDAVDITLQTLKFYIDAQDNPERAYKGFYYHFFDNETGNRKWNCELSSIDTSILMMGIIFARNYYDRDTEQEKEIRDLAEKLLENLDWSIFNMGPQSNHPNTISMAWTPEKGTTNWGWHGYTEGLFLYILAAGTGIDNPMQHYQGWLNSYKWKTPYPNLSHVTFPPLFGHQFSHTFIDFRGLTDQYLKEKGISYFENSRRATLTQQQYAIENPKGWKGYDAYTWGFTATDGPGPIANFDDKEFEGYAGRGSSGPDDTVGEDGTIGIYAPISSLPFTPELSIKTIKNINEVMGDKIWGKYGYYDSFNQTANWISDDFFGIDQGPLLLMIENFRTGMIWNYVMPDPVIQNGLETLKFDYLENTNN